MSSKPHYFVIGLFVLIATALGLIGVVAVTSDAMRAPKHFIETYLDESVQGIDVGTPFKFRGVKVGNVSKITMVSAEYDTEKMYVMVRVALNDKEMVSDAETIPERVKEQIASGLRLKLVPQGITGLSFLEAEYYPETNAEPLEIDWEPKYTYIPSTPSMMKLLGRSIEHMSAELNTLNLKVIGENVENITSNLNISVEHIEYITRNAATASDDIFKNIGLAAANLPSATTNLTESMALIESIISDSDQDLERILSNLSYITEDTRELIRMIKRYPGILLTEPPKTDLSK